VIPPGRVDLLVIGGGMAGLTAAAVAAHKGLAVLLAEKAPAPGGSAAMSHGYMWTAPTLEALQWEDPTCDVELGAALVEHFPEGLEWVASLGVELGEQITGIYGIGYGHQTDIRAYLDRCRAALEGSGGQVVTGVRIGSLTQRDGRVTGAVMRAPDGNDVEIEATWALLCTGGFQGDAELRRTYIGPQSDRLVLRSNPYSTGDGLKLGLSVGATASDGDGFYGHLIPNPLDAFEPEDWVHFAQLHSGHCLLVNERGERFTDESLGDHVNTQALLGQPGARGVILGDEHVRRTHVLAAYIDGMDVFDKLEFASARGANYAVADTVADLAELTAAWGFDASVMARTVASYGDAVRSGAGGLAPPSTRHARALDAPPYFALEVRPAITFPYAGLATDADAKVLGADGPIPGLLAAGVDVGGVNRRGYTGALARGLVFGTRAALTAAGEPSWRAAVGSR
jgi:succinate dehydrogenase/fumarate reductase flavoprotein subunit